MNADNIAVLDKGRLVEQGTHDSLVRAGGVYSSLVARQVKRRLSSVLFQPFRRDSIVSTCTPWE